MDQQRCPKEMARDGGMNRQLATQQIMAGKIINIAEITAGMRVLALGTVAPGIETAVYAAGACIMPAGACQTDWAGQRLAGGPADVALYRADAPQTLPLTDIRRAIDRHLRIGGRLVVWTSPACPSDGRAAKQAFSRLVTPPKFTCTIIGQLPPEDGGAVVGTGILVEQNLNGREMMR